MGIEISFQTAQKCILGTKFLSTQMDKHTLHLIGFKNLNISSTNKLIKESVQKYLIQKKDLMEEYALSDKIKSAMFASMAWY